MILRPLMHPSPTMASRDYHVRISAHHLGDIVFEHLFTQQDPCVLPPGMSAPRAGTTEWVGRSFAGTVTIGWDWAQSSDGAILLLKDVPPRTNLMVLDSNGYDRPSDAGLPDLWALIEMIAWRVTVAAAVSSMPPLWK